MIEINHSLLSPDALDNLILEVLTRQSNDGQGMEINIETTKKKLMNKLDSGELIIVFNSEEGFCDIVSSETFRAFGSVIE